MREWRAVDVARDAAMQRRGAARLSTFHKTTYLFWYESVKEIFMQKFLSILPERFKWTLHNLVAHPLSEVLYQLGFENEGNRIHDWTVPTHERGTGRG